MNGVDDEEEEEEEEEEEQKQSTKQMFIINKVESILERLDILPEKKQATTIAGETESETKTENKSFNKEALDSINNSILRLAKKDKKILKHLKQFADLAEKDFETYTTAIDALNSL